MISIVICSQSPAIDPTLEENIKTTIGSTYELVYIFNENNRYSIFSAYNIGVQRSKGDIICFMHDDVEFLSIGWGAVVESIFNGSDIAACAVAGAKYMRRCPSYYPIGGKFNAITLVQYNNRQDIIWNDVKKVTEVVVFDGLWFCIRRDMFQDYHINFDEINYRGFHFYDIDMATQIIQTGKRVVVLPDVLIKHKSGGITDKSWLKNSFIYSQKWKHSLPLSCISIDENEAFTIEKRALYSSMHKIIDTQSFSLIIPWMRFACSILRRTPIVACFAILMNHINEREFQRRREI